YCPLFILASHLLLYYRSSTTHLPLIYYSYALICCLSAAHLLLSTVFTSGAFCVRHDTSRT
ncbi:hypothetical protein, partial [Paenibacillus odorifer]|uniref:hypothetical protein n=1 Tax=Paenibacillus odorifer TaxID=189426 RepID=UPI001C3E55FA